METKLTAEIEPADGKIFFRNAGCSGEQDGIKYSCDSCIDGSMVIQVGKKQWIIDAKKVITMLFNEYMKNP